MTDPGCWGRPLLPLKWWQVFARIRRWWARGAIARLRRIEFPAVRSGAPALSVDDLVTADSLVRPDVKQTRLTLQHPGEEYDPAKHISAQELRAMGATIPAHVPDCAWMPRGAWTGPFKVTVEDHPQKAGVLRGHIEIGCAEALRWEENTVTIDGPVDLTDLGLEATDAP